MLYRLPVFRCVYPISYLVLVACALMAFSVQSALAQVDENELYVYVDDLPDWASYATNVMRDSTRYWEERIPGLRFYQVDDPLLADFRVQWVKEFGVEHVGYAYGSKFIEVGLGDSDCRDQWNPFSTSYVSDIMIHEIGHILGYTHTDDPTDIMYPIALNWEYGIIESDHPFVENYGHYIPLCSSKQVTSFNFHISTDDPVYGFDVYAVPGPDAFDSWSEGEPFEYYADNSCFGEGYLQYGSTCEDVAGDGGLLIVTNEVQSNPLTTITVKMQEISETKIHNIPDTFPAKPQGSSNTNGITNSYNLFIDPHGRYTMQYPSTWIVDAEAGEQYQVGFYDEERWTASLSVLLYEGNYAGYANDEIIDSIIEFERDYCDGLTHADDGQICYDFEVVSREISTLASGQPVYTMGYVSVRQYSDPLLSDEYYMATMVTELHDGENIWNIIIDSNLDALDLYSELLGNSGVSA